LAAPHCSKVVKDDLEVLRETFPCLEFGDLGFERLDSRLHLGVIFDFIQRPLLSSQTGSRMKQPLKRSAQARIPKSHPACCLNAAKRLRAVSKKPSTTRPEGWLLLLELGGKGDQSLWERFGHKPARTTSCLSP